MTLITQKNDVCSITVDSEKSPTIHATESSLVSYVSMAANFIAAGCPGAVIVVTIEYSKVEQELLEEQHTEMTDRIEKILKALLLEDTLSIYLVEVSNPELGLVLTAITLSPIATE